MFRWRPQAQRLDVQVQELSGLIAFVSDDPLGRIKPTHPIEAVWRSSA